MGLKTSSFSSKCLLLWVKLSSIIVLLYCVGCSNNKGDASKIAGNKETDFEDKLMVVIPPGAELMKDPAGEVVVWLPAGEEVFYLSNSSQIVEYKSRKNFWYKVRTKSGNEGWIWGDCLTSQKMESNTKDSGVKKSELEGLSFQQLLEEGNSYIQNDNPSQALPYLEKAIELAPNDSLAWFLLGLTYQNLGQDEKAIEPYKKVIELAPKDFWAHNNLGLAYIRTKQFEKAVEVLEVAVKLQPPSEMYNDAEEAKAVATRNLITAYRSLGKNAEAEALIAKQDIH